MINAKRLACQGKPTVHAHMVVGLPDETTKGGHVLDAHTYLQPWR